MKYAIISAILLIVSCKQSNKACSNSQKGKAVLVAYRVAKHSHLWFENTKTGQIYDIGGVGGRREPNINLGDTINVEYCDGEIVLNRYNYVKEPRNRETRYISLNGYENLY